MSLCKGIFFVPAVAELHDLCFDKGWSEDEFRKLLALPTSRLWMDENSMLLCSEVAGEMEILTIGVIPEMRRQHLAQKLLEELFEYAQKHNIKRIFLEVAEDNSPAQKLYFKVGFKQMGRRNKYYARPNGYVDALCLVKEF